MDVLYPICTAVDKEMPHRQCNDEWGNKPDWCPLVEITNLEICLAEAVYPTMVYKTVYAESPHTNPEDSYREDFKVGGRECLIE